MVNKMAGFEQFGNEVAEEKKNESLGYEFTFKGDELEQANRPSLFRAVAPGEYDFTVDDIHFEESKKGNKMIRATLSFQDADGEVRVDDYFVCTEEAKWKFAPFFASIGQWDFVRANGVTRDLWDAVRGMRGRFEISNEVFNDKTRNRVKKYIAPGTAAVR